jgi:acyl carrier protein
VHTLFVLQTIFREVFGDDRLVITPETSPRDIPNWGSVNQMQLILAIEEQFDFHFTTDEVSSIKKAGDFIECIRRRSGETP